MFKKLVDFFSKNIGIDLGTTNTRVYVKGKGLIIDEPTIVAVNRRTDQIIAFGQLAHKMIGKAPPYISIIKPIVHGVVSDFEITEKLLKLIFKKVQEMTAVFFRPRVVTAIPLDVTEVEKKSLEDVILQAGAKEVYLVERPMAAAIGVKLPIHESIGNLIVELGGGLSEVAVISLKGVVTARSLKIGGETFDQNIINWTREKYSLLLGEKTAEDLKRRIGSAMPTKLEEMKVRGRDLISGLPKEITISNSEIEEAIRPLLRVILNNISETIEATPPELVSDIYERGMVLSGGIIKLKDLKEFIQKKINIPVHLADDSQTSVIRGLGLVLEDFENLKQIFVPSARD